MFKNAKIVLPIKTLTANKSKPYEKKAFRTSLELTRLQKTHGKRGQLYRDLYMCSSTSGHDGISTDSCKLYARNDLEFAILVFKHYRYKSNE